jgi:hypothetical protein
MSRRRDVRLEAPRTLMVSVPTAKGPLALKDISIRGLCLVAQEPLPLRSAHRVTLTLGHRAFTHRARAVHCHQHPSGGWLMGMEFIGEPPAQRFSIDELLDELLASSITFY